MIGGGAIMQWGRLMADSPQTVARKMMAALIRGARSAGWARVKGEIKPNLSVTIEHQTIIYWHSIHAIIKRTSDPLDVDEDEWKELI